MKNNAVIILALAAAVALFSGCAHTKEAKRPVEEDGNEVRAKLDPIKQKYAPDPRLFIFNISAQKEADTLILKGEVDNPEAKKEINKVFAEMNIPLIDQIKVLPSEKLGGKHWGIVRISVANIRDERAQGAELGSQVLMGHVVKLWKEEGGWYYAQSSDRYLGWMEDDVISPCTVEELNRWSFAPRWIVTAYEDRVWERANRDEDTLPVSDVVMGVLLRKAGEAENYYKVELPDGRTGFIAKTSVMDYDEWQKSRKATPQSIERTAKSFMGSPYLWGGTSSKGMDCSGFTKMVYFLNGVPLNRNASHQARQGTDVPLDPDLKNLKKGDLLFFGRKSPDGKSERIVHVGIYLENKKFIHSSSLVKINSLDSASPIVDERRMKSLIRAKRVLPE